MMNFDLHRNPPIKLNMDVLREVSHEHLAKLALQDRI